MRKKPQTFRTGLFAATLLAGYAIALTPSLAEKTQLALNAQLPLPEDAKKMQLITASAGGGAAFVPAAPQSAADNMGAMRVPSVGTRGSGSTEVEAAARFIAGASVTVEYDSLGVTNSAWIDNDNPNIIHRRAYVRVQSARGEPAYMTCDVTSTGQTGVHTRDCNGNQKVEAHAIMGGQSESNNILLSNDLMPAAGHDSNSSISIKVSYI